MRGALVWIFRRIVGIYFREVEVTGNVPGADTARRIFVSNHTNGLVDPILVLTTAPCPISPVAKSTLFGIPGLRWLLDQVGAVPVVRRRDDPGKQAGANDEVFDKVSSALAGGHNILIFPEGTSHNEPRLIEVKSGAARMLVRARERGARGLTFQAVALEFDERNVFRSRSLLVYGPVRSVDELAGGGASLEGDALVAAITAQIREDLAELLVEGATWPERLLIARIAEMLTNDTRRPLARALELHRPSGRGRSQGAAWRGRGDRRRGRARGEPLLRPHRGGRARRRAARGRGRSGRGEHPGRRRARALLAARRRGRGALRRALPAHAARGPAHRGRRPTSSPRTSSASACSPTRSGPLALAGGGFALLPAPIAAGFAVVVIASPFAALAWHDAAPRVRRAVRFVARADRIAELRALRAEAIAPDRGRARGPAASDEPPRSPCSRCRSELSSARVPRRAPAPPTPHRLHPRAGARDHGPPFGPRSSRSSSTRRSRSRAPCRPCPASRSSR